MSSAELPAAPARPSRARFLDEIREQPEALLRLVAAEDEFARVAAEIRTRAATTIRMVGHGSSDNAASYGVYAFGLLPRWTALQDSISLTVYYGAELDMSGCTVLALSQSGRTPDVVEYARQAKSRGAYTVAVTNDPASELALEADAVLELRAGHEHAVAATKTYSNQIAALGLLAAHAADEGRSSTGCVRSPRRCRRSAARSRRASAVSPGHSRTRDECSSSAAARSSRPHGRSR